MMIHICIIIVVSVLHNYMIQNLVEMVTLSKLW